MSHRQVTKQSSSGRMAANQDSSFSFLQQLKSKDLQELLDNPAKLNKMVDELQIVKNQSEVKNTQITSNKSLAEYNLSCEPRLIQARKQLSETYDKAVKVQKEYEKTKLKHDTSSHGSSLDTALAVLQTEAAKAEEQSEVCAESFLSRKMSCDSFLNKYISLRMKGHERKVKVDKMTDILGEKERVKRTPAAPVAQYRAPAAPAYTPEANGWGMGALPYPVKPSVNYGAAPVAAYR